MLGRKSGLVGAEGVSRIPANKVVAVCTECYHVTKPGRVPITCPLCGAPTVHVMKNAAKDTVKSLKERGNAPLAF